MFNREKLEKICLRYSFDKNFNWEYKSDVNYNVSGCAMLDVDKTTTTYESTLYGNYFNSILGHSEVERISNKIEKYIKMIEKNPSNPKKGFDGLYIGCLKGLLREEWHVDACSDAAIETVPAPGTKEFILDLINRKLVTGLITYSLEDALVLWYNHRIGVPGVHLRGIRLKFKNGVLYDYDLPKYGKVSFAKRLVNKFGFSPDEIFAVDDDPILDKILVLMLGIGFVIWVDENKKNRKLNAMGLLRYPGKICHVFPEAKKNMQLLTQYVDKWRRARAIPYIKSPSQIIEMNSKFNCIREIVEKCKREKKIEELEKFITHTRELLSLGYPIVSTVLSGIDDLFSELELRFYKREYEKELIVLAEEICKRLYKENVEFQLTEKYIKEIKSIL